MCRFATANGITKSHVASPPTRPQMPTLYFMHFQAICFLPSFYVLFISDFFEGRMLYVEHDRLAVESRSVLKDIRVLILM